MDRALDGTGPPGLPRVHRLAVERRPDGREHFGFADGFAQPAVAGAPRLPGRQSLSAAAPGRPLPPGEFLLGHRDVEYALPPAPNGPLGRNGTYMVYRELAQDVGAFRSYLRDQAVLCGLGETAVAAKMVGRWPDGSPLMGFPDRPEPAGMARDDPRLNDFSYGSDPEGLRCPLGAHIRRVNPRDSLGFGDRLSRRHRMIRRGMTWGPRYDDDPEAERGLAFVAFVADIRRQFEFVQAQWCNDGNAFFLGSERDPLVGRAPEGAVASGATVRSMTLPGAPPRFLSPLPEVVRTVGGEYFLLPGIAGLRALSVSRWS
jgi:Dyp-type peroxidase family